jgi:trehalose-6-phosphate synthase
VKVIVGVDRLDYIKGVPQKLHALELFLSQHPEWVGRVVLAQLAVPSRGDVEEYQNLRATVNELVGRINGRFGTVDFMPIHFMHKSLPFDELCALYAVSDVCLVSSTRDGMNLVSYEYIACQQARQGALVLSEFAGAAQSLNGSIVVNPWDAIYEAVTMDSETRAENHRKLFKVLSLVCELESMDSNQHRSTSTSTRRHSGARASSRRWSNSTRRVSRRNSLRLQHRRPSLTDCMYCNRCTTIETPIPGDAL